MSGWIKIHREIQGHWISQCPEKLGRWIDLLLLANFEDKKVLVGDRLIEVKRGQMIMSFDYLAKRWNISKSTASKFIELLESDKMVERHTEQRKTILTICNYDSYQQKQDDEPNIAPNNCRTTAEQLPNTFKERKEDNNINNNLNSACACEEKVVWDAERERGFCEAFKASGKPMALAREIKSGARGIMIGLERFVSFCEVAEIGHKDTAHFGSHFRKWMLNESVVEVKEQPQQQRRVTTNEDTYRLMQEMGWQNS